MKSGLLEHMRTYVRSVETGSFTAVAIEQGQTQPTVSRQISALEEYLGARLLHRTTRALAQTEEGRTFYEHARSVLDATEQAALAVRPGGSQIKGTLRIAAPVAFARLHLMPRLSTFLKAHPDLETEWVLGGRQIDLVEEGVDMAIRIGTVTEHGLIVRRIGETRRLVVATPDYLAERGVPDTPDALRHHDCIIYTGLATRDEWHFRDREGKPLAVRVEGRVRVNASEGVRATVLEGLGIAVCPTWLLRDEIAEGKLTTVLMDYEPEPLPIQTVMPSRRLVTPRVRAFTGFLAAEFSKDKNLGL